MKSLLIFLFVFLTLVTIKAQELDSVPRQQDSTKVLVDSAKRQVSDSTNVRIDTTAQKAVQDTTKKETKEERRARKKAEKEREKYYYKDILKDSARLEIERLSRVAWRRSLLVPGWGQYTNGGRLWWIKASVIYGGFLGAVLVFDYWQWYYTKFRDEATYRINNGGEVKDPDLQGITQLDYLIRQKDYGRRNRDITILATVGWWGINVVEAYTTSILKYRYEMSDELSLKISPTVMPATSQMGMASAMKQPFVPGIRLTMNIK